MSDYYPVFLDVRGKRCVVVGGGEVALRRVKGLLQHGANVVVVSPELCSPLNRLAGGGTISVCHKEYTPGDLKNAFIVIAATDDVDVNIRVVKEARRKRIPVNVVDNLEQSDFILPSSLNRGDVTVAVSTAGKSPALARKIRTHLEEIISPEYASLVQLIGEVRSELKAKGIVVDGNTWQEAIELGSLLDLLQGGHREQAKANLLNNLGVNKGITTHNENSYFV
ncbi:bifunctional precorrin-2 dehydrogenase/sirohydrochlorin ferrochelatase [Chloroflexota bacterium]